MTPEVLIIPDVHGRTFWKEAINKYPKSEFPNLKIVFLGDYLDPYESYDGISKEEAFVNFEEILDYANRDSRVTLLIGNHDWHYFVYLDTCRMDFERENDIKNMFKENISRFRMSYSIILDGCKYLFTHAGITQKWLDLVSMMAKNEVKNWNPGEGSKYINPAKDKDFKWINEMSIVGITYDFDIFEKCLQNYNNNFYTAPISMISRERGGYYSYGSLIWADVHEHLFNEDLQGYYQIFGHTYSYPSTTEPAISQMGHSWAMLDCAKAFIMDIEGNIEPL